MLSKDKKRIHVSLPNRTYNRLMEEKDIMNDDEGKGGYHFISDYINQLLEISFGIADDGEVINYIYFLQNQYNV